MFVKVKLKRRSEEKKNFIKRALKRANANFEGGRSIDIAKARIALYMAKGLDVDDACKLCGCSPETLNILRADPQFERFVKECAAINEDIYLSSVEKAASTGNWQAAAWFLERRFPDKYGKRDIVRHEYQLKIETFQKVVLKVLNQADPSLRIQVVRELRKYNFDGSDLSDHTFQPSGNGGGTLALPEPEQEECSDDEE